MHPSHQHEATKAWHWEAETMMPKLSCSAEEPFLTSFCYVVQWELPLLFSALPELSDSTNPHQHFKSIFKICEELWSLWPTLLHRGEWPLGKAESDSIACCVFGRLEYQNRCLSWVNARLAVPFNRTVNSCWTKTQSLCLRGKFFMFCNQSAFSDFYFWAFPSQQAALYSKWLFSCWALPTRPNK